MSVEYRNRGKKQKEKSSPHKITPESTKLTTVDKSCAQLDENNQNISHVKTEQNT